MSTAGLLKKSGVADHFTIVGNDAARDRRLSLKARGLLLYLLSHRDGWTLSIDRLARQMDEGKAAIRGAVHELEALGYLTREQTRGQDGLAGHSVWLVTDSPSASSPSDENRTADNRPTLEDHGLEDDPVEDDQPKTLVPADADTGGEDDVAFERFWQTYPKRDGKRLGKAAARKAWGRIRRSDREAVMVACGHYRDACDRRVTRAKDAERWLRPGVWEDWGTPAVPDGPDRAGGTAMDALQRRIASGQQQALQ